MPERDDPADLRDKRRVENLKDMVLYRFGSTGVVQCLSRAAELLGLVPIFPVRNVQTFSSGSGSAVFRDCVLVKKYVAPRPFALRLLSDFAQEQHRGRCRPQSHGRRTHLLHRRRGRHASVVGGHCGRREIRCKSYPSIQTRGCSPLQILSFKVGR